MEIITANNFLTSSHLLKYLLVVPSELIKFSRIFFGMDVGEELGFAVRFRRVISIAKEVDEVFHFSFYHFNLLFGIQIDISIQSLI